MSKLGSADGVGARWPAMRSVDQFRCRTVDAPRMPLRRCSAVTIMLLVLLGFLGVPPANSVQADAVDNSVWRNYGDGTGPVHYMWMDDESQALIAGWWNGAVSGGLTAWNLKTSQSMSLTEPQDLRWGIHRVQGGEIWIGSGKGLLRLNDDGTVENITPKVGLPESTWVQVIPRSPQSVWLRSSNRAVYEQLPDGSWEPFRKPDGTVRLNIAQLLQASDGATWLATVDIDDGGVVFGDGLLRRSPAGQWEEILDPDGDRFEFYRPGNMVESADGSVWIIGDESDRGVYRYDPDSRMEYIRPHFGQSDSNWRFLEPCSYDDNMLNVLPGKTGDAWLTTGSCILHVGSDGKIVGWNFSANGAAVDKLGGLWATGHGVAHFALVGGKPNVTWYDRTDGVVSDTTYDVVEDAEGRIWVATQQGISWRDKNGAWGQLSPGAVLPSRDVHLLAQQSDGALIVGTEWGLASIDPDSGAVMARDRAADALLDRSVTSFATDGAGNTWFGTSTSGALRIGPEGTPTWIRRRADGVPWLNCNHVEDILLDSRGNLWFATVDLLDGGAYRLAPDGTWTLFQDPNVIGQPPTTILSNLVVDIAEDKAGNLWFVTDLGVSRLAPDGTWSYHLTAAGERPSEVFAASDGSVWFGRGEDTEANNRWQGRLDRGAVRIMPDGRIVRYREEILDGPVHAFAEGEDGSVFVAVDGAIRQLRPDGQWQRLLTDEDVPGTVVKDMLFRADGSLWLATDHGINTLLAKPAMDLPDCDRAIPLLRATEMEGALTAVDEPALFVVDVGEPFSHLALQVEDPDNRFELLASADCAGSAHGVGASSGSGRHIGVGAGRHVKGRTMLSLNANQPGRYYVRLGAGAGPQGFPARYRLSATVTNLDRGRVQALFVTHRALLESLFPGDAAGPRWWDALNQVAAVTNGMVIDIADVDDDRLQAAFDRYTAERTDLGTANAYALALRDWLWRQRERGGLSAVRYVVLVGDDRVIPHFRQAVRPARGVDASWRSERDYLADAGVATGTGLHAVLQLGDYVLTDDVYGSPTEQRWRGEATLAIPELAVGRLVESPTQIQAALEAYLAASGRVDVRRSVSAGWDHMADGPRAGDGILAGRGLSVANRVLLDGDAWSANDLDQALRRPFDLAYLGMHATHYLFAAPDRSTWGVDRLAGASGLAGRLIYTLACHGGLNVPGVAGHRRPADFPEAMLAAGAAYVGSTGWAYGQVRQLGYQEALMTEFTDRLVPADRAVPLGDALVAAKQAYFLDHEMDHYDAKTLAGTVLYGLPMYQVGLAAPIAPPFSAAARRPHSGPLARPADPPARPVTDTAPAPAVRSILPDPASVRQGPLDDFVVAPLSFRGDCDFQRQDGPDGSYFRCGTQATRAVSGAAVQPRLIVTVGDLRFRTEQLPVRGVVVTGLRYHAVPGFTPVIERAGLLGETLAGVASDQVAGWTPSSPTQLRSLATTPLVGTVVDGSRRLAQLLITFGQHHPGSGVQRLIDEVDIELLYSGHSDWSEPDVQSVAVDERGILTVRVVDPGSDVARVQALCDDAEGGWRGVELAPTGGQWSGDVAAFDACVVQTVDRAGNVRLDDNLGQLFDAPGPQRADRQHTVFLPVGFTLTRGTAETGH